MAANWPLLSFDAAGVLRTSDGRVLFRREQDLGAGGYGAVAAYVHEGTGLRAAIKAIPKTRGITTEQLDAELDIGRGLHHPNIAGVHAAFQTETDYLFVMECVEGGSLHDKIGEDPLHRGLHTALAVRILMQLVDAIEYMHEHDTLHRDLKPNNVVLVEGPPHAYCKLIDFGMAGRMVEGFTHGHYGFNNYLAPETSLEDQQGPEADVFGLGHILYCSLTGRLPFPYPFPLDAGEARDIIQNGLNVTSPEWNALNSDAQDLLIRMLSYEPHRRPSLAEIRTSAWVTTFKGYTDTVYPPVSAKAVTFLQACEKTCDLELATQVAKHMPMSVLAVAMECGLKLNGEAIMLYNMMVCRDAKSFHGAP